MNQWMQQSLCFLNNQGMQFVHSAWDRSFKKERLRPPKSLEERKTLHWLSWFFSPYLTSLALNRRWSWRSMEQRGKAKWTLVSKSGSHNVVPMLPLTSFVTSSSRFCLVWFMGAEPSYTLSQIGCLGSWWLTCHHPQNFKGWLPLGGPENWHLPNVFRCHEALS